MTLLFLNSLGTWEVIFILLAVLMLFGSKSIPGLARNLGKGMKEIRNASNEIKRDIQNSALEMRKDLDMDEVTKEFEGIDLDLESDSPESKKEAQQDRPAEDEKEQDDLNAEDDKTIDINSATDKGKTDDQNEEAS
ncbi:twin-arginine translocase TatA/TatE family subunit [Crocinitomix catalasitica]|nr:twin-arginine translocase TatA/TatE family subunit [Crocinitomix catalasitica]